uniref:Uncharacterized protein n=1 Tax=Oryza nivara TaxID=4536 RepID=A0A0E0I5J7_ORYNI
MAASAVAAAIFLRLRQVRGIWPPSHLESLSRPAPSSSSRAGGPPPAGHRPPLPPAETQQPVFSNVLAWIGLDRSWTALAFKSRHH